MLMDSRMSPRYHVAAKNPLIKHPKLAYKSDIVLAGIGCITEEPLIPVVVRMGFMEPHEFTEIHEQGAVGYTCGWFFQ
jgi:DNA-binding transcriptional regulator LsrR (DeoR family)